MSDETEYLYVPRHLERAFGVSGATATQDSNGAVIFIEGDLWEGGLSIPLAEVKDRLLEVRRADGLRTYRGIVRG